VQPQIEVLRGVHGHDPHRDARVSGGRGAAQPGDVVPLGADVFSLEPGDETAQAQAFRRQRQQLRVLLGGDVGCGGEVAGQLPQFLLAGGYQPPGGEPAGELEQRTQAGRGVEFGVGLRLPPRGGAAVR
jgi:hypothetical protein